MKRVNSQMDEKRVKIKYKPREQFRSFHCRKQRWSVLVCHRRAGNHKDIPLLAGLGGGKVKVGENTMRSEDAHGAIIQEIVRFFSAAFLS